MTTFVLIPGVWLGGWVWDSLAVELTKHGHRAVPVTLTNDPQDGVSAHTRQLGELLAAQDGPVVLVGHSYGIFPALGAADRAPERVSRLVFLDAPLPEDGESLAELLPAEQREQLVGELLPYRSGWNSAGGVPEAELERMRRLARPWPVRSFTEPIALGVGRRSVPTTGVFCTENGMSVELVRSLHGTGLPRFAPLDGPGVTYFELPTGHLPMLSMPVELAEVLERAAEGKGPGLYS